MVDEILNCIELDESSGPVSPRFQYSLHARLERGADGAAVAQIRNKTSKGVVEISYPLSVERWSTLAAELTKRLPLGKDVDLVGEMRTRKGISFNFVRIDRGAEHAKVDYLLSHAEGGAHPDLTLAIEAIKAIVTEAVASQVPSKAP